MIVSFDIYVVLSIVELVLAVIFLIGIFTFLKERHGIQLLFTSTLLVLNVIELPMEVLTEKNYGITIFLIILWFFDSILHAISLGKEHF